MATLSLAMAASFQPAAADDSRDSPPPDALQCAIDAPKQAVAGRQVMLRFTLSNTGARSLQLLRWNTPWEGAWFAPFVTVQRNGRNLSYSGPSMKRADPLAEHYFKLDAGTSTTAELDLALPFTLNEPGRYRVTPRIRMLDWYDAGGAAPPRPRAEHRGSDLACPTFEFVLRAA